MVFRDQGGGTLRKLAAVSTDDGATWSKSVETNVPDSRSKQSAGNLPDGTAYLVSNPTGTATGIRSRC
ncbi:exo-alpha-sialidase [Nonomuraea angiospora]